MYKSFDSIEDSYYNVINLLKKEKDEYLKDSYIKIKTLDNLSICIKNPRKNLINCPTRHLNYKMLLGELLYNLQGKDDVESIKYYNASYEKLSDNKDTINAMLGARIFFYEGLFDIYKDEKTNSDGEVLSEFTCEHIILNQFEKCCDQLTKDNNFNINIYNPLLDTNTNHMPEISNLFFYIKDNKLNLNVNVLEFDFYTRYPYLSFILSTLQAILAKKINKDLGKLIFNFNLLFTFSDKCDIIIKKIYNNIMLEDNKLYDEDIFTTIFDLELMSRIQGNLINIEDCKNKIISINNKYWESLISCLIKLNTGLEDFNEFIIEEHKIFL